MNQRLAIVRSFEEAAFAVCEVSRHYIQQLSGNREPRIVTCCGVKSLQPIGNAYVVFESAGAVAGTSVAGSSPKSAVRIDMDRDQ
jgi:hypothetical protein